MPKTAKNGRVACHSSIISLGVRQALKARSYAVWAKSKYAKKLSFCLKNLRSRIRNYFCLFSPTCRIEHCSKNKIGIPNISSSSEKMISIITFLSGSLLAKIPWDLIKKARDKRIFRGFLFFFGRCLSIVLTISCGFLLICLHSIDINDAQTF